jgi:hypothetical protein
MKPTDHDEQQDVGLPSELVETDAFLRHVLGNTAREQARDLNARVVELALEDSSPKRKTRSLALSGVGALAAGLVLGIFASRPTALDAAPPSSTLLDDGFRAKGFGSDTQDVTLVSQRDGALFRIQERMHPNDAVLVAYTNAGRAPARALAVFAVDTRGQVFWLYPAYTDEKRPPSSIPIETGVSVELPDAVRHDFVSGALRFVAVFTLSPVSVVDLEAWVTETGMRPFSAAPQFPGAVVDVQDVTVTP